MAAATDGSGHPASVQPQKQQQIFCATSAKSFTVVTGQIPDELRSALVRDFTEEEVDAIAARANKTLAPASQKPAALWIFGPSAVGKSFISSAKCSQLFGCAQNAVAIDGAEFREVHEGFHAVTLHGHEHGVLHADAWKLFKNAGSSRASRETVNRESTDAPKPSSFTATLKQRILRETLRDRQHLVVPDCANHPKKLQARLDATRPSWP